ncbi:MAG: HAD family hydrolase [Leptolyngbyaceae cyanobacterium MO_188.B28]|nr:HAD family hydrolase [Leptolyngbyaceae cyanobacterium MO_188.B28]
MNDFDWIFFDCFNTLIDDFDQAGDESGLGPMEHLPVEAGIYPEAAAFRQDYFQWRRQQWANQWREVALPDRLGEILRSRSPKLPGQYIDDVVARMLETFEVDYPKTLRLPQGVSEMLDYWQGKVNMGVVSNFPLADWPEQLLEQFGLRRHFDFVLDSALCGWKKPGPEIYQAACQLAGIPDSGLGKILFIGDHIRNDVLMPMELGMQAIYLDRSDDRPNSAKAPEHISTINHWSQFRRQ